MGQRVKIVDVSLANVDDTGFFCYMSKRKSEGYARKLAWLKKRFDEGLRIKMITERGRGFIEYIPGEFAWRGVEAKNFMFIHCIWVVGQSKGKGDATLLLNACINDARNANMDGVAIVTSEGNWLVSKAFFLKNKFESVDAAPPSFELLVKKFRNVPSPTFIENIGLRPKRYKSGLTVFRSDQCPYLEDATKTVEATAGELGLSFSVIESKNSRDVRTLAPSVYGVFSIVYRGKLLSHHYLLKKDLMERIVSMDSGKGKTKILR